MAVSGDVLDVHAYCRDVEAYLCRRNGGHLIRLVGPAFEMVRDWAAQGIPLTVVCDGIDRVVVGSGSSGVSDQTSVFWSRCAKITAASVSAGLVPRVLV